MYEASFALAFRPFVAVPSVDRYFPAASIEAARAALTRCIERGEGPGMLAGPAGIGKTLLLEVLAAQFKDRLDPIRLTGGQVTNRRALLQVMLFELGLPYRGKEEAELRLALIEYLSDDTRKTKGVLLLVDEAHNLPVRLLEEIRMVTNIIRGGEPRVHLILAGNMGLEEKLTHPKLDSLSQRMAARCYLDSFNRAETCGYIAHAVSSAGGEWESVFSRASCEAIYRATAGIPRLINQMADHALLLAYAEGASRVDPDLVERAWSDLQQLPTPWAGADPAGKPEAEANVVEFGQLPDESTAAQQSAADSLPLPESVEEVETISHAEATLSHVEQHLSHLEELLQAHVTPANSSTDEFAHESLNHEEVVSERYGDVVIIRPVLEMESDDERHPTTSRTAGTTAALTPATAIALLPAPSPNSTDEVVVDRYARLDAHRPATAESGVGRAVMAAAPKFFDQPEQQPAPVNAASHESADRSELKSSLTEHLSPDLDFSETADDEANVGFMDADEFIADLLPTAPPANEPTVEYPSDLLDGSTSFNVRDVEELSDAKPAFSGELSASTSQPPKADFVAVAAARPGDFLADVPELVVVEDPPAAPAPVPSGQTAEVRRQEYRQLFARLRRGA